MAMDVYECPLILISSGALRSIAGESFFIIVSKAAKAAAAAPAAFISFFFSSYPVKYIVKYNNIHAGA